MFICAVCSRPSLQCVKTFLQGKMEHKPIFLFSLSLIIFITIYYANKDQSREKLQERKEDYTVIAARQNVYRQRSQRVKDGCKKFSQQINQYYKGRTQIKDKTFNEEIFLSLEHQVKT